MEITVDPIDRYLKHLLRSNPESPAAFEERAKALTTNLSLGLKALSDLNHAKEIFIGPDLNYEQLYDKLKSLFDEKIKTKQTLLVGVYNDPSSSLIFYPDLFEPLIIKTRYKVHLCSFEAGDQAVSLTHESNTMLRRLGIEPDFDYFLSPLVGRRIFEKDPFSGSDRPLPVLKMIDFKRFEKYQIAV